MDKKSYLMQYDCLTGDEYKIWYIASRFSSLMEIDRSTGAATELLSLQKEGRYRTLIKDGNRLLLIPVEEGNLWIYDITNGKTTSYAVPDIVFCEGRNWSAKYIRFGKFIYFSWENPVIVRYDLVNDEWKLLTEWRKLLPKDCLYNNWFQNDGFLNNGFLYFPIGTSRMILKLNPNNNKFEMLSLQIPESVASINNNFFSDGELWSECKNVDGTVSIYCCKDWETFQCERVYDFDIDTVDSGGTRIFSIIEKIGDDLLLLPGNYDKVYLLNVKEKAAYVTNRFPTVPCDNLKPDWFSAFNYYRGLRLNKNFLVIHSWTQQLIEIGEEGYKVKKIPITVSDEVLGRIIKNEFKNDTFFDESEGFFDLDGFLRYVLVYEG